MNTKFLLSLPVFLALGACSKVNEAPAEAVATASEASAVSASSASAQPADTVQTLSSKDGKIRIAIENGRFADVIQNKSLHPDGISADELTLLQHDASSDITIYAGNLGKAQTDAQTYFAHLKETLQSAKGTDNMRVGAATDNRMNYQFSQAARDGGTLSENCIAIHESNVYTVCASSTTASAAQLAVVLKDVNLTQ